MPGDDPILFTPVTLTRTHATGWTADTQVAFIAALARTGVVAVAARSVGRTARSANQLRARIGAESFADAWDRAVAEGQARAIDAALARSFKPVMVPVIRRGQQVGWREKFDTPLAIAALRALDRSNGRWPAGQASDPGEYPDSDTEHLARFLAGDPELFTDA